MATMHIKLRRFVWSASLLASGVALTAALCPSSFARQDAKTKYEVAGRWQGKFPREEVGSEADNPVAVEIVVRNDGDKISGTSTFYVIVNRDNKPQVKGSAESELIDPQFDGITLRFTVKAKGQNGEKAARIKMAPVRMIVSSFVVQNEEGSMSPHLTREGLQSFSPATAQKL